MQDHIFSCDCWQEYNFIQEIRGKPFNVLGIIRGPLTTQTINRLYGVLQAPLDFLNFNPYFGLLAVSS